MEFYGLPDAFLPSQPASVEPLVPRLSVYTLGQALQHLDGANFSAAAAKDGKAAKLVRLAPTFVIRSPSSIILDAQAKAYWNGEKGDDEIMRCSEVLLERYATYPDDAEESAFWTALNRLFARVHVGAEEVAAQRPVPRRGHPGPREGLHEREAGHGGPGLSTTRTRSASCSRNRTSPSPSARPLPDTASLRSMSFTWTKRRQRAECIPEWSTSSGVTTASSLRTCR
ncbi:hypothetical protein DFJ74DRAFT_679791 [Hyaloraphidium curvatum]|nr:hypothetical protein DFJ74DRAFT_679791 [Hyaloraphidium curvatum]